MPKSKAEIKNETLHKAKYVYNYSYQVYVNKEEKKLFTLEAIVGNNIDWLIEKINEQNFSDEWKFYPLNPLSKKHKEKIIENIESLE